MNGKLYLVPAPLDFGCSMQAPLEAALPDATLDTAAGLADWICENAKSTRALLKRIAETRSLAAPMRELRIVELPRAVHKKGDATDVFNAAPLLEPALQGRDVGLASEAGLPAVADPGASVVRAAHRLGIAVVPLVGPSSLMLALAASGLNGQQFAFVGYLPQDAATRAVALRELESLALKTRQTQIFIEAPYRNIVLWQALLATLRPTTSLSISSGLTLPQCICRTDSVASWRQLQPPVTNDCPTVFAIGPA